LFRCRCCTFTVHVHVYTFAVAAVRCSCRLRIVHSPFCPLQPLRLLRVLRSTRSAPFVCYCRSAFCGFPATVTVPFPLPLRLPFLHSLSAPHCTRSTVRCSAFVRLVRSLRSFAFTSLRFCSFCSFTFAVAALRCSRCVDLRSTFSWFRSFTVTCLRSTFAFTSAVARRSTLSALRAIPSLRSFFVCSAVAIHLLRSCLHLRRFHHWRLYVCCSFTASRYGFTLPFGFCVLLLRNLRLPRHISSALPRYVTVFVFLVTAVDVFVWFVTVHVRVVYHLRVYRCALRWPAFPGLRYVTFTISVFCGHTFLVTFHLRCCRVRYVCADVVTFVLVRLLIFSAGFASAFPPTFTISGFAIASCSFAWFMRVGAPSFVRSALLPHVAAF